MLRCTQARRIFSSSQTPGEARSLQWGDDPNPTLVAASFFFATESSKKHACGCRNRDGLIFHHLVEQLMHDEVFTGSTCSNSPACGNAGKPCRIWPVTILQVKSSLCCVLVKEVIMLQRKYLLIVLPTAVHQQFSLQRMTRLLEQAKLFTPAERDGNGGCPALPC